MDAGQLKEIIKGVGDYSEIRFEENRVTSIGFSGKKLDSVRQTESIGGCIRVLKDGGWGFSAFNSLQEAPAAAKQAEESAKIVGRGNVDKVNLAPVSPVQDSFIVTPKNNPGDVSLEDKVNMILSYSDLALSQDNAIVGVNIGYAETLKEQLFVNSDGSQINFKYPLIRIFVGINAKQNGISESHALVRGSTMDYAITQGLEDGILDICKVSKSFTSAELAKGGNYTCVVGPEVSGIFIHEAFGHLSEGDRVSKNKSLREVMALGRTFAQPFFNVYDSGIDFGHFGSVKYDDEGTPMEKTYLIKDGKLVGRLHSRESAAAMNEKPTGSARAISYKFPPIPRMRNTCIEAGETEFKDMFKGIDLGVYVKTPRGGQTGGEMFTFTAAQAYMIRDGKIAEPVRGVTISGNLFDTLKNIDLVGNDFNIKAGSCGKGEQYPLPVSSSGPTIRMKNVVVGGR